MNVGFSPELLGIGAVFVVIWVALSRYRIPALKRSLSQASAADLPGLGKKLAGAQALRDLTMTGVIAFGIVLVCFVALNIYLSRIQETEAGLVGLMELRQQVDLVVDRLRDTSATLWGITLVILCLIWIAVVRSRAQRSWSKAIEARRTALAAQAQALDIEALRIVTTEEDPDLARQTDNKIAALVSEGHATVREALSAKLLTIGDEGSEPVSLADLMAFRDQLAARADAVSAEGNEEEAKGLNDASADIDSQIKKLKSDIMLEFNGVTGPVHASLANAEDQIEELLAPEKAQRQLLVDSYINHKLAQHTAEGRQRAGAEPENLREWIVAGSTGETMTKGIGRVGRVARYVSIAAFLLGFVGLGTTAFGTGVTASLMQAELGLANQLSARSVTTAMAQTEAEDDFENSALASNEATSAMLRSTMRASFARAVQSGTTTRATGQAFAPRQRQSLASVNARQQILAASVRPTAAASGSGHGGGAYAVRGSHVSAGGAPIDAILQAPIDQRIAQLRSNERVWTNLRAAAARPASPNLAAEQFLRVAFGDDASLRSHQVRMLANQVTTDIARTAARSGTIPYGHAPSINSDAIFDAWSDRDRRIIGDFKSRSTNRASRFVDGVSNGRIDPGSLHRASPSGSLRYASSGSAYANLFPASLDAANHSGATGGRRTNKPSAAAKSYKAIRFNRRVGGVVIGRGPEGVSQLDIIGFDWSLRSDLLEITLIDRDGARLSVGVFDPAIAHHALAYAADGRVVTSTLPAIAAEDSPLDVPARRVVVHPAFEDTAFACAAIQIDRFVDATIYRENATTEASTIAAAREAVTGFATILQYAGHPDNTPIILEKLGQQLQGAFEHANICGTGQSCFPMQTYAGYGLEFGEVDKLMSCFAGAEVVIDCAPHLTGLYSDTTYSVDSGVRESGYTIDSTLDFLTGAGTTDPLWPLDFIVQAVPQPLGDSPLDISEDWEPWTFPSFADSLRVLVADEIVSNPGANAVFRDMRDFVVLQRLFRTALDGHLGFDFPFLSIIEMQHATANNVLIERQEHWNAGQRFFQFMFKQADALAAGIQQELQIGAPQGQCRTILQKALEAAQISDWPREPGIWSDIAGIEAACSLNSFDDLGQLISDLHALDLVDEAIYIHATWDQLRGQLSCLN